tara:strand:+ start:502 stop:1509 length:1008 start_codon:yes stop_codon:yes gene_type:complete
MERETETLDRDVPLGMSSIQTIVAERLEAVQGEIGRIIVSDFGMIKEVNECLLSMKGKLFRPTLVLLANEVGEEPSEDAVTLGALVELVHLATLVHDDAVDHSVLRRGLPTVNALWTHQVAVIMGDYLYSRSVSELVRMKKYLALSVLANAANQMSIGEMRQLTSVDALEFSEEDYSRLIECKTASLISAACEIGSLDGATQHSQSLADFGHNLGMAFQIADDLLDYRGKEEITGKPSGQDLRERKVTLPLVASLSRMSKVELRETKKFFTLAQPTDRDIEEIVGIVRANGGLVYAENQASLYAERAKEILWTLPTSPAVKALENAVTYAVTRNR